MTEAKATLMLHCGAKLATWQEVCDAPLPEATSSYSPVPYKDMVEMTRERCFKEFGVDEEDQFWEHGLQYTKGGTRYFGVCRLHMEEAQKWGLAIALRGSTDYTTTLALGIGGSVFCCDNLAMSADSVMTSRKHTGNAYEDFRTMLYMGIASSVSKFDDMSKELTQMSEVGCSTDRGYELIGRAMGNNVLAIQEASTAVREWRAPSHEEFEDRTVYSLYNAFTEAAKKTRQPGAQFGKYSGIHKFFAPEGKVIDIEHAISG